jgi:hypothetical protein
MRNNQRHTLLVKTQMQYRTLLVDRKMLIARPFLGKEHFQKKGTKHIIRTVNNPRVSPSRIRRQTEESLSIHHAEVNGMILENFYGKAF